MNWQQNRRAVTQMENNMQGRVTIAAAAKVLHMDKQTIRLLLQRKLVDWGTAVKLPGSNRYCYIIYAQPFYAATGYRGGGTDDDCND